MKTFSAIEPLITALIMGSVGLAAPEYDSPGNFPATAPSAPLAGYGIDVLQWDIEVRPGEVKTFSGTVQEVYSQVLKHNPEYQLPTAVEPRSEVARSEVARSEVARSEVARSEVARSEVVRSEVVRSEVARSEVARSKVARSKLELQASASNPLCGNFGLANKNRIQEGITYLRTLGNSPRNGPGPSNCARVSCSYNSAIYWCNDNDYSYSLNGWNGLANSAQTTLGVCAAGADEVSGQNFEQGNWNTVVCHDYC